MTVTVEELREQEQTAEQMHSAAYAAQLEHHAAADAATDPAQRYILLALEQIQGCHARHFKSIAVAYGLAADHAERAQ